MAKFRKKPVEIEAIQFKGGKESFAEIQDWANGHGHKLVWVFNHDRVQVPTLEGVISAAPDDWIIRGVQGEIYPCKPDIFEETYEAIDGN